MPWSHALLQDQLDKIISSSNPLRSFQIKSLKSSSPIVINECFQRILSQDLHRDGLDEIDLEFTGENSEECTCLDQRVWE